MTRVKHIKLYYLVIFAFLFLLPCLFTFIKNPHEKPSSEIKTTAYRSYFIFYEDFEGSLTKWDSHSELWHITERYHYAGDSCVWFGDEDLGHLPDSGANGVLISEPIDLSSQTKAFLAFYLSRETASDALLTILINNTSTQEQLTEYLGASSLRWTKKVFNISHWCGNSSVRVKINADHTSGTEEGWYIDNLVISPSSYFTDITDPTDTTSTSDDNNHDSSWVFWFLLFFFGGFGIISVIGIFFAKKMSEKQDLMNSKKQEPYSVKLSTPIEDKNRPTHQEKEEPQLSYIICPACGIELEGDAKFCYDCGKRL